jgi:hypothetical protein
MVALARLEVRRINRGRKRFSPADGGRHARCLLFAAGVIAEPPEGLSDPQPTVLLVAASVVVAGVVVVRLLLVLALCSRPFRRIVFADRARDTVLMRRRASRDETVARRAAYGRSGGTGERSPRCRPRACGSGCSASSPS